MKQLSTAVGLHMIALIALIAPANASTKRICNTWTGQCWYEKDGKVVAKPTRTHKHTHKRRKPEVRTYVKREEDDRIVCKDAVTVIGDARPSETSAREDAEAVFMRTVRFRYGESWMEVANAKNYAIRCARASITEVLNQTMQRCELRAQPCRIPFESR